MYWIKEPNQSLFKLMHNDIQLAYIISYGYGWYGGTNEIRFGCHESLFILKSRILNSFITHREYECLNIIN